MKLKIRVPSMLWWILGIVSIGGLVISNFNLPNFIYYIADGLNIFVFFYTIQRFGNLRGIKGISVLKFLLLIFVLDTAIGILGNGVSGGLAIWGMRNIYRYIIFMFSCLVSLYEEDIDFFINLLPKIYFLNFALTLFQFFFQGKRQDFLGGLFGIAQGCNGATTIFLNIFIAIAIAQYLEKKISLGKVAVYSIIYLIIAALSETKGNFIFFVVIVILALMISRKSRKTIGFGLVSLIAIFAGLYFLDLYFPGSAEFLFDWDKASFYMDASYFGTTTFTRNAILQVANEHFFKDNLWLYLFGYGIGACDMSSYFTSPFYAKYGYMNYRQFSSAMTILQTGYIGFVVYIALFVVVAVIAIKDSISGSEQYRFLNVATACIAIFAILDSFYASLYIDMGYWVFFIMAVPLIIRKTEAWKELAWNEE